MQIHNNLLQEFDDEMDETQGNMLMVQRKLEKLLSTSDKGRLCCLFLLMVVAIGLLFLIIYT